MIRNLSKSDYLDYIDLIKQLTSVGVVSESQFFNFVDNQSDRHRTIIYELNGKVAACLTYLIEQKIQHSYSNVMHIEDVVVDTNNRGTGLSRILIEYAISLSGNCYKVILNCTESNVGFYKHLGFSQEQFQMSIRNF